MQTCSAPLASATVSVSSLGIVADRALLSQVVDPRGSAESPAPLFHPGQKTEHTSPALTTDPERDHFRGFARRPVNLAANVIAGGGSWQRQARVLDLGLGGARVALSEVIPPSTPLSLIIDAPHLWAPLEIEAR